MERALANSNARIMKKSSKYYASIYYNIPKMCWKHAVLKLLCINRSILNETMLATRAQKIQ